MKEAELAQIIFRTRLMIKQRELSKRFENRRANPPNIEKKLRRDEDYFPLHPEHSRRKLENIAKKSKKGKMRSRIAKEINEGLL